MKNEQTTYTVEVERLDRTNKPLWEALMNTNATQWRRHFRICQDDWPLENLRVVKRIVSEEILEETPVDMNR